MKELEIKHKLHSEQKILEDIKKIRTEINDLATQAIKKNRMFLKQRYYESGSKYIKILAWKLKKKIAENTIHRIRNPRTKVMQK